MNGILNTGNAGGMAAPMGQGSQIDPQTLQAILQLQQVPAQQAQVQKQQAMAQALRQMGQRGQESISPGGGRAGPPNWAGTLANIYAQYRAGQMDQDAQQRQDNIGTQRADALRRYFMSLTGQGAGTGVGYMGEEGE